jgi:hypothetical protein
LAVISLYTVSGTTIFSKSSFRIDSLLIFSSTINGLAFDTITLFALTLPQAPPRLCW